MLAVPIDWVCEMIVTTCVPWSKHPVAWVGLGGQGVHEDLHGVADNKKHGLREHHDHD